MGRSYEACSYIKMSSGVRRKFSWGGFIHWYMVVICLLCAVFVTSQFDVVFMFPTGLSRGVFRYPWFPNQDFGEVR